MLACDDDLSIRGHDDRVCDRRAGGEARHYAARLAERWVDLPRPHARKREARAAICLQRPGRHDGRAVRLQRETNSPDSAAPFAGEAGGEAIQDNEAVLAKAWIERVRVRLRTGECRASAAVVEHGSSESGHCRQDRGAHEQSPPACAPACLFDQRLELPDAAFDLILVDFRLARRCDRQALPLIG